MMLAIRSMWTRSRALCAAILLLGFWLPVHPDGIGGGIGGYDGIGAGIGSPDGVSWSTSGAHVFLKAAGSDGNDCLTPATACQTPSHVSGLSFTSLKVTINANGGDTLGGGTAGFSFTTSFSTKGPILQSYGTGQATISTGNSAAGLTATNVPGGAINNVAFVGGGNTTNTTAGISIVNSQAGNTKLAGWTISGVTVSGYGYNAISIQGTSGTSGFNGVVIANNTITNVTGNSTDSFGTSCIMVFSKTGYGNGITAPSHTNVTITGNTVSNCTGTAGNFNWSGSGIFVAQSSNVTIGGSPAGQNVAHDFGINSTNNTGGPTGIWAADGANINISYNEAYNGRHGSGGFDGDGFGLNGGVINSSVTHNYAHNNAGSDYIFAQYNDSTCCTQWGNNTVAWNIGQDAQGGAACGEVELLFETAVTGPLYVYRNTFFNQINSIIFGGASSSSATVVGTIANNLILGTTGGNLVSIVHPTSLSFYGNDYYTYGAAFAVLWNGTGYASFSAWQTATGQEKISGSNVGLTVNPQVYVAGGGWANGGYVPANLYAYELQSGAAMIGAGVNLQTNFGINPAGTDYFGAAVAAGSLTVGAAEGDFGTFVASCTASSNFLARVSSFNKLDNVNYNSLICGEVSDGDFANLDLQYMEAAPNHAAAILNLVSSASPIASLTEHGTCSFTARVGITGDGSTCYEDTGFNAATASSPKFTQNSGTIGDYNLTNGVSTVAEAEMGFTATTPYTYLGAVGNQDGLHHGNVFCAVSEGGAGNGFDAANTVTSGALICQRTAAAVAQGYYNGAQSGAGTTEASAANTGVKNLFLFASSDTAGPDQFSSFQHAADFSGNGSIVPANISQRLNSFMRAHGINVY
jgi:hypothetical protein